MSARIIFEVRQNGGRIDLRLVTEMTPRSTAKEKAMAKVAKDCLDEYLRAVREAADETGVRFVQAPPAGEAPHGATTNGRAWEAPHGATTNGGEA